MDSAGLLVQVIDRTRDRRFTRRLTMTTPDLTSAEWITEAPTQCAGGGFCQQTALAPFTPFAFTRSFAMGNAVAGTISSPNWVATSLRLVPRPYRAFGGPNEQSTDAAGAGAEPGALTTDGAGFSVAWDATPQAAAG